MPDDATKTQPDARPEKIHTRWQKGRFGGMADGVVSIAPTGAEWYAYGRFASSGREVSFEAPTARELASKLKGAGWLPYGAESMEVRQ